VVLIHQGGQSTASTINDKTCPGFSGDIVPILNGLNKNVDVVVSGHTHMEYVCNFPAKAAGKNILVTSTGFYGGAVSEIDLVINPSTGLASASANTVPVIQNVPKNAGLPAGYTALDPDTAMAALVSLAQWPLAQALAMACLATLLFLAAVTRLGRWAHLLLGHWKQPVLQKIHLAAQRAAGRARPLSL
jgi:2',3'-cyclic-nucleotide 2'-phosphodiesterase (5'-nucleotidase family)